jgi:hypothetical protein
VPRVASQFGQMTVAALAGRMYFLRRSVAFDRRAGQAGGYGRCDDAMVTVWIERSHLCLAYVAVSDRLLIHLHEVMRSKLSSDPRCEATEAARTYQRLGFLHRSRRLTPRWGGRCAAPHGVAVPATVSRVRGLQRHQASAARLSERARSAPAKIAERSGACPRAGEGCTGSQRNEQRNTGHCRSLRRCAPPAPPRHRDASDSPYSSEEETNVTGSTLLNWPYRLRRISSSWTSFWTSLRAMIWSLLSAAAPA